MEIIIFSVIILGYCLILGVNLNYILLAVLVVVGLFSSFMFLLFLYCIIRLLFSKPKKAKFVRFENIKNSKFQAACYLVDGEEYPCLFPKEGIMENILYQQGKTYSVMFNKKMGKVYDRFAIATCVIGLIFGVALSTGIIYYYINI